MFKCSGPTPGGWGVTRIFGLHFLFARFHAGCKCLRTIELSTTVGHMYFSVGACILGVVTTPSLCAHLRSHCTHLLACYLHLRAYLVLSFQRASSFLLFSSFINITEKRGFLTCTPKRSSERIVGVIGLAKCGVLSMVRQSHCYCESEVKTPLSHF